MHLNSKGPNFRKRCKWRYSSLPKRTTLPCLYLHRNKNGSLWFCVDYPTLNALNVRNSYPFHVWMSVSTHSGTHWYSPQLTLIVAFASGDWRCWLRKNCIHLTSRAISVFLHSIWTTQCTRNLPTDNRLQCFTSLMAVWPGVSWRHYCIFTTGGRTYKPRSYRIVAAPSSRGHAEFEKCKFFTENMDYLGHVIRPCRLEPAFYTTNAICDLEIPKKGT